MESFNLGRLTGSSQEEVDTYTSVGIESKDFTSDSPDEILFLDVTHGPFRVLHRNWCLVGLSNHERSIPDPSE